ncbi:hypothetical protein CEXT_181781 [Caerostris extrusa]|uniref:Uncharacterized protein n=1 Tax=Caerostris extrusa TaxID=172846 RepID=A0AAV4UU70_CAEEX|nr:hypothetical protein CEXT_181781 [Caerostris extrusa]
MNNPGTRRQQINRKLVTSLFEAKLRNAFPSSLSKARPKDIFQCNILHLFYPSPITSTGGFQTKEVFCYIHDKYIGWEMEIGVCLEEMEDGGVFQIPS